MFTPKTPKGQKQETSPISMYYGQNLETSPPSQFLQIVSIDPSFKNGNYAMRIEKIHFNQFGQISTIEPLVFTRLELGEQPHLKLTTTFESSKQILANTNIVLIERQLPQNYQNIRIQQHSQTLLIDIIRQNSPSSHFIIYEVSPSFKSRQLQAPSGLNAHAIKAWAIEKCREILTIRNDRVSLDVLDKCKKKKDDLSDTVVQSEAFYRKYFSFATS